MNPSSREANPFIRKIDDRVITSEAGLKKAFRKLAQRLHPDKLDDAHAHVLFLRMKEDYDEASAYLRKRPRTGPKVEYDRDEFLSLFSDLVASNFPVDERIIDANKLYARRKSEFAELYGALCGERTAFESLEKDLYAVRGDDIVMNEVFGMTKNLFYVMASLHRTRHSYLEKAMRKELPRLEQALEARKKEHLVGFLRRLEKELEA